MEALMILAIIEKLLKYGPKAVIDIAKAFENETPTVAEIRALTIKKEPKVYFDAGDIK